MSEPRMSEEVDLNTGHTKFAMSAIVSSEALKEFPNLRTRVYESFNHALVMAQQAAFAEMDARARGWEFTPLHMRPKSWREKLHAAMSEARWRIWRAADVLLNGDPE